MDEFQIGKCSDKYYTVPTSVKIISDPNAEYVGEKMVADHEVEYLDLNKPRQFLSRPLSRPEKQNVIQLGPPKPGEYDKLASEDVNRKPLEHPYFDDYNCNKWLKIWDEQLKNEKNEELNTAEKLPELEGVLVVYINVGNIPTKQVDGLLDKMKKGQFASIIERIPSSWSVLFVPIREGQTRLEQLRFE